MIIYLQKLRPVSRLLTTHSLLNLNRDRSNQVVDRAYEMVFSLLNIFLDDIAVFCELFSIKMIIFYFYIPPFV